MSYGWLTESSLQPRRARELHVTAGSLLSLSAALAETEAKAEKRRGAGHAAVTKRALFGDETFRDTTAALRITRPSKKPRTPGEAMFETRNEGVEERMAKDKAAHAKSAKTIANSRMKLEEKAKLYDALGTRVLNMLGPGNRIYIPADLLHCRTGSNESREYCTTNAIKGPVVSLKLPRAN
eukprot:GHVT01032750.1.p1 GENE.GHVT01032750.1~~GHVT01032750.1.p1  ORF type:complete len:181 (+),score=23.26 GHVT01032750.1:883-1425(+)